MTRKITVGFLSLGDILSTSYSNHVVSTRVQKGNAVIKFQIKQKQPWAITRLTILQGEFSYPTWAYNIPNRFRKQREGLQSVRIDTTEKNKTIQ